MSKRKLNCIWDVVSLERANLNKLKIPKMINETCNSRRSPCIFKAAYTLCTTSNLSLSDAMKLAGYKKRYFHPPDLTSHFKKEKPASCKEWWHQ
jgi:hypothetical protein